MKMSLMKMKMKIGWKRINIYQSRNDHEKKSTMMTATKPYLYLTNPRDILKDNGDSV